jgi:hypothetical protein
MEGQWRLVPPDESAVMPNAPELGVNVGERVADFPGREIRAYRIGQLFSAKVDPGEVFKDYRSTRFPVDLSRQCVRRAHGLHAHHLGKGKGGLPEVGSPLSTGGRRARPAVAHGKNHSESWCASSS